MRIEFPKDIKPSITAEQSALLTSVEQCASAIVDALITASEQDATLWQVSCDAFAKGHTVEDLEACYPDQLNNKKHRFTQGKVRALDPDFNPLAATWGTVKFDYAHAITAGVTLRVDGVLRPRQDVRDDTAIAEGKTPKARGARQPSGGKEGSAEPAANGKRDMSFGEMAELVFAALFADADKRASYGAELCELAYMVADDSLARDAEKSAVLKSQEAKRASERQAAEARIAEAQAANAAELVAAGLTKIAEHA